MTKIGGLLYFYNFRNIRFEDRMCNYIYVSKDSFYFIIEIELIIESKFDRLKKRLTYLMH